MFLAQTDTVKEETFAFAISAYHHLNCEFKSRRLGGVLDTTLCDKVCQWLAIGRGFSPCNLVYYTNKTEMLLKAALNIHHNPKSKIMREKREKV